MHSVDELLHMHGYHQGTGNGTGAAAARLQRPRQGATVVVPVGDLEILFDDDSIPDGIVEIDGTRITLDELHAATEGA